MINTTPCSGPLLPVYRVYGQSTALFTSFTTEIILTTETIFGTVTVDCNGAPIGTSLVSNSDTSTGPPGVATETVIETVSEGTRTQTQTIPSTITITDSVTTTAQGAATDVAISAGVPFALNIFGPGDISLAAVVDSNGVVDPVDASTATGDATPVYIDDLGFIRLLNSQDDVLYFPDLTFPKLFKRQGTNGKAATKPESQLTTSDTPGNFSASVSNIVLKHDGTNVGLYFDGAINGRRGFFGVPSGQTPASSLTSGTVKGSVVSTSVSATKGISTAASAATTGTDAIITSYSSFCQAYLSLAPTTTQGSTTTVPSTILISTNFSNTTVSSPGPLESTQTKTPETTVSTVGTFETWSTPVGERRKKRQASTSTSSTGSTSSTASTNSTESTASTNSTASITSSSTVLATPEALQPYASDVISSACKARITYTGLISTSLFYVSQGTETSTTDVGETSTIYGPASSTITETQTGTTVPVTATIVATAVPQPTPMSLCRIGTGSNICWELKYTQTTNSSTDPLRIWFSDTSRELMIDIPLFTLDEYGRLTYTHPATNIKLYAALPKGNPTEGHALTFVTPQFKIANSFGYVKWFWDSGNNNKLILDPDNDQIINSGETPPTGIGQCFYNSPNPSPAPQYSYMAVGPASSEVYSLSTTVQNCFMGLVFGFRA
ncbi:hypothetical protein TWF970_007434 [Orbilia oligospora]|uniref:Uncharacterized protein n=1 Tax=Orbilia oligospora TaxID=2813651 RepID=A0A7C8RL30_ORBOL|nr:hypothetical protein TWF970_007434 [Orbilia oligospora]